jgi:RNA polymerase sigma-70 factor, ECF subfamily
MSNVQERGDGAMQSLARENAFEMARRVTLTDEEIVARVVGGEVPLFEVLMRRHNQKVYRAVRSLLRDETEAEDAMQQTYLAAYLHLSRFEGASRFSTWLVRIAINEALGRLRRRHPTVALDEGAAEAELPRSAPATDGRRASANPEERAMSSELSRLLEGALDAIPETYRVVFMLREVEGMDTAETAEALEVSEETVKTRLHRARAILRERLYETVGVSFSEAYAFLVPRCDRIVARVLAALERYHAEAPDA